MEPLLPLFVKLRGRDVLVVGGGNMGTARVLQLAEMGARVTVVAPEVHAEAEAAAAVVRRRPFRATDLDGAWLAVAAAPPEVNRAVLAAAEARRILVNAVDDPAAASAYFAGTIRRGNVTVAVSTGGAAPALAGLLREGLAALLPDDLSDWAELARRLRPAWKAEGVPLARRRPLLLRQLQALYAERGEAREGTDEPDGGVPGGTDGASKS